MKYLIVGLGNIGAEYAETRHNIGFKVLDALVASSATAASNVVFSSGRYGTIATLRHRGQEVILLKPSTYMNLSGKAVRYWMQQEKIPAGQVLVVVDDIALPLGQLRIRKSGSDGGHNGLKDIQATLGHADYPRMRLGVGGDFPRGMQVDYVLGEWSAEEREQLPILLKTAGEAVLSFAATGLERTMNLYNTKK